MVRNFVIALVLFGSLGLVYAQEDPASKPKSATEDPFGNEGAKEVAAKPDADAAKGQPRGGHQIQLLEPAAPDKSLTLEERLMGKASLSADEAPLAGLPEALSAALDAPVVMSARKLEEAAISLETPVTYKLKNVKLHSGLKLLLEDVGLTFVVKDEVVVITTPEDANSRLVVRVYDCRELMKLPSPVKKGAQPNPLNPGGIGTSEIPAQAADKGKEVGPDGGYTIDDLIRLITTTVVPDSWDAVGGPGSIADFKGLLTISQTQDTHEEVEKLLNMLHKAGGVEEKVKVSR